jgi:hypothetical protein
VSQEKPTPISHLTDREKAKAAEVIATLARWGLPVKKLEVFREPKLDETEPQR